MTAKTVISIVAALALLAVGAIAYYLTRPVAEEASIDNALTALDDSETAEADEPTGTDPEAAEPPPASAADGAGGPEGTASEVEASPLDDEESGDTAASGPVGDVTGTWTVDTAIGEFDFADATTTFVGFRVAEELRTVGQTEAVGRTPAVAGELEVDAQVAEGNILVVGRAPVVFADFDITAPQAGPVVAIEDSGTMEVQLWFSRP